MCKPGLWGPQPLKRSCARSKAARCSPSYSLRELSLRAGVGLLRRPAPRLGGGEEGVKRSCPALGAMRGASHPIQDGLPHLTLQACIRAIGETKARPFVWGNSYLAA